VIGDSFFRIFDLLFDFSAEFVFGVLLGGFDSATLLPADWLLRLEKPESFDSIRSFRCFVVEAEQPNSFKSDDVRVAEPEVIFIGMFSSHSATAPPWPDPPKSVITRWNLLVKI
jgi:hypothetical protein